MLTRRSFLAASALLLPAAALLGTPAFAGKSRVFATDGIAINGFDPVGYFTEAKAVKGTAAHASDWEGAQLLFASAENQAMFEADREKYAPKYGGYCAFAVSKGSTASTDPEAWTVHNDRLYLNYSVNVRSVWREDVVGNISKADANWPGVLA